MGIYIILNLAIALFFSGTDLLYKKIPNMPIAITILTGILLNAYLFPNLIHITIINTLVSIGIAFVLFWFDIWKAGDGKLLIAFTASTPPFLIANVIPPPIVLTSLAFVIGLGISLPPMILSLWETVKQAPHKITEITSDLMEKITIAISTIWIIRILLRNIVKNNMILYLLAYAIISSLKTKWLSRQNKTLIRGITVLGLTGLLVVSRYLRHFDVKAYLLITTLYISVYSTIDLLLKHIPEEAAKKRIPLAPLMACAQMLIISAPPQTMDYIFRILRLI